MSGAWFTPTYADTSGFNSDCWTLRPARIGTGKIANPNRHMWFNPSAFVRPPNYIYGDSGRNILQGPGWADADLSLFKQSKITEKLDLELRMGAFNAFNRTNLTNPNASVTSSTVGVISSIFDSGFQSIATKCDSEHIAHSAQDPLSGGIRIRFEKKP
jgi:hypothetical protein